MWWGHFDGRVLRLNLGPFPRDIFEYWIPEQIIVAFQCDPFQLGQMGLMHEICFINMIDAKKTQDGAVAAEGHDGGKGQGNWEG